MTIHQTILSPSIFHTQPKSQPYPLQIPLFLILSISIIAATKPYFDDRLNQYDNSHRNTSNQPIKIIATISFAFISVMIAKIGCRILGYPISKGQMIKSIFFVAASLFVVFYAKNCYSGSNTSISSQKKNRTRLL